MCVCRGLRAPWRARREGTTLSLQKPDPGMSPGGRWCGPAQAVATTAIYDTTTLSQGRIIPFPPPSVFTILDHQQLWRCSPRHQQAIPEHCQVLLSCLHLEAGAPGVCQLLLQRETVCVK